MNNECFLRACELIKSNLFNLDMKCAYNSIGSNVFFEFGKEKKIIAKNGKERTQREWSIWLSDASWRISKSGKYIVGSGDSPEMIQSSIQKLLGKRFQSIEFLSSFLDAQFNFDDEYQITTFFNWSEENQWTIFLPDQTNIGIDCSSHEEIKNAQNTSKHFLINENYQKLNLPQFNKAIADITYNEYNQPSLHFENDFSINFQNCVWRLEKDNDYFIGCLDENKNKTNKLSELIGKKIKQVDIANLLMDAKFQFEDQYIIKTFSCSHEISQWMILCQSTPIFNAKIIC